MSELRTLILGACLTMGATGSPLGAQQAQHDRAPVDSARQELQRLDSLYAVRRVEYAQAESASAAGRHLELVEHGALRIRVAASLTGMVREAAATAMPALEARGGEPLRARIARHLPSITLMEDRRFLGTEWHVRVAADTGRYRVAPRRFASVSRVRSEAVAAQLAWLVETYAMDGADSVLVAWMMAPQLPLRDRPASAWTQAYVEMMTVESVALRRCRTGDAESCLAALGILPDETERIRAWYAPEDYRDLARLVPTDAKDTATSAAIRRCRGQDDVAACTVLIAKLPAQRVPPPLTHETRHLFMDEVLRAGGDGAYARLMSATGSMRQRLEAAAAMPLEQIVDRWRARVMEARPRESTLSPVLALATLGWCGLLTLAAFTRRPTCG